jgi:hypothetical protein
MTLRVRQIININSISVCYNGKGDDGEDGFVHFFTLDMPGKETTFTVPEISVAVLSRVLDKVMDRYTQFSTEVSKAKHEAVIVSKNAAAETQKNRL